MMAWVAHAPGGPAALRCESVPEPAPEKGELQLRVLACGLNHVDLVMLADRYQVPTAFPHIPGLEVCGIVMKRGPGTEGPEPGTRVIARLSSGGLAATACARVEDCFAVSKKVPTAVAATFLLSHGTAQHFLYRHGRMKAGSRVLVLGAAGAVGSAALALCRSAGARASALVAGAERRAHALTCGALACIEFRPDPDDPMTFHRLKDLLREHFSDGPPDIVLDPLGGGYSEAALRCIAPGGRHLVVGFTAGIPRIPLNLPLVRRCAIIGDSFRAHCEEASAEARSALEELVEALGEERLAPPVPTAFSFSDADRAFAQLAGRTTPGRVAVMLDTN